jgi:hypothetical protein
MRLTVESPREDAAAVVLWDNERVGLPIVGPFASGI